MPAALRHLPVVCLRSTPVGAKRVVYTPFRSLLYKRHWRLATQARSVVLYVLPSACLRYAPVGAGRVPQARSAVLYVLPSACLRYAPVGA